MRVLALGGWKQNGKDTVADYLVRNCNFIKFSFASTLKDMVSKQYNIPKKVLNDSKLKEKPLIQYPVQTEDDFTKTIHTLLEKEFREIKIEDGDACEFVKCWTPRALMILEGSIKRSVNSGYWTKKVIDQIKQCCDDALAFSERDHLPPVNTDFVISDLRYKSEVKQLKDAFGTNLITLRVNRFGSCPSSDPSERDLDDHIFDINLNNNSSLEDLYKKLDTMFSK